MANSKRIIIDWAETAKSIYCIVRRESDKFILGSVDGAFTPAPENLYLPLTEDTIIKGRYERNEDRTVWSDGRYTVAVYKQAGVVPSPSADVIIGSGELAIKDDSEVYLDALPSFIHKWILNRLVESPSGTWKLYDDDNSTVLKTWNWDNTAKARSKAI